MAAPTVPGGSPILFPVVTEKLITVSYEQATDDVTAQGSLEYKIVKASSQAEIDSIEKIQAISGPALLSDWAMGGLSSFGVASGLSATTTYWFAVLVKDGGGSISMYAPQSQQTAAANASHTVKQLDGNYAGGFAGAQSFTLASPATISSIGLPFMKQEPSYNSSVVSVYSGSATTVASLASAGSLAAQSFVLPTETLVSNIVLTNLNVSGGGSVVLRIRICNTIIDGGGRTTVLATSDDVTSSGGIATFTFTPTTLAAGSYAMEIEKISGIGTANLQGASGAYVDGDAFILSGTWAIQTDKDLLFSLGGVQTLDPTVVTVTIHPISGGSGDLPDLGTTLATSTPVTLTAVGLAMVSFPITASLAAGKYAFRAELSGNAFVSTLFAVNSGAVSLAYSDYTGGECSANFGAGFELVATMFGADYSDLTFYIETSGASEIPTNVTGAVTIPATGGTITLTEDMTVEASGDLTLNVAHISDLAGGKTILVKAGGKIRLVGGSVVTVLAGTMYKLHS